MPKKADDALVFDTDFITVENITEFKEYHGLHIPAVGYLDRTRIPVGIDIGFWDVVYPDGVKKLLFAVGSHSSHEGLCASSA